MILHVGRPDEHGEGTSEAYYGLREAATSREKLMVWLCRLHNIVNRDVGNPEFNCEPINLDMLYHHPTAPPLLFSSLLLLFVCIIPYRMPEEAIVVFLLARRARCHTVVFELEAPVLLDSLTPSETYPDTTRYLKNCGDCQVKKKPEEGTANPLDASAAEEKPALIWDAGLYKRGGLTTAVRGATDLFSATELEEYLELSVQFHLETEEGAEQLRAAGVSLNSGANTRPQSACVVCVCVH
eukprot:COSAG05_NODE_1632_length_4371_cov_247.693820_5_plen_240_part_00